MAFKDAQESRPLDPGNIKEGSIAIFYPPQIKPNCNILKRVLLQYSNPPPNKEGSIAIFALTICPQVIHDLLWLPRVLDVVIGVANHLQEVLQFSDGTGGLHHAIEQGRHIGNGLFRGYHQVCLQEYTCIITVCQSGIRRSTAVRTALGIPPVYLSGHASAISVVNYMRIYYSNKSFIIVDQLRFNGC